MDLTHLYQGFNSGEKHRKRPAKPLPYKMAMFWKPLIYWAVAARQQLGKYLPLSKNSRGLDGVEISEIHVMKCKADS
ncbi:hypothetical protein GCM10007863_37760 [Dyella mobilis]|nr:hypothetical protein GCM10007863_37760 [Dyella mobilis]